MAEISDARFRAGEGETLVLLHGFTATWRCWMPVLADLVPRFDVYAPTVAGHDGGPEWPANAPHTLGGAAELLERDFDEQGIERPHIVGNSMGGALAIELARRGRARSVTALAPGAGWARESGESERLIRFFKRQQKMAKASAAVTPHVMRFALGRKLGFRDVMRHGELMQPAEAVRMARSSTRCTVAELVYSAIEDGSAMLEPMHDIDAPILVAWPEHDRVLPLDRHAPRFREELRGVDFRVLPGCGHVPMWDAPEAVVETILDGVGAADRHAVATAEAA